MTNLTLVAPGSSYGDVLTFNNAGSGVSATLSSIQDGFGNNSAIQLSTIALTVTGTLSVTGTLQVGGIAIAPTGVITLASLGADPASPVNGMMYYRTSSNSIRAYVNGAWGTVQFVAGP